MPDYDNHTYRDDSGRTTPVWIDETPLTPLAAARAVAYSRTIANAGAEALAEALSPDTALEESRAEVAHYAYLNKVLADALKQATDTANNAVIQEQELRDELDELRRDHQELWERAVRADELEAQRDQARAERDEARAAVSR